MAPSPQQLEVPPMFRPGSTISLKTSSHPPNTLTFTIIHPCTPFSKSVTLLVRPSQPTNPTNPTNPTTNPTTTTTTTTTTHADVILKMYDGRFYGDRYRFRRTNAPPQWTLTAEIAASLLDLTKFRGLQDPLFDDDSNPNDPAYKTRLAIAWEAFYHSHAMESFEVECKAYSRLQHLQESGDIPRFLLSGDITPPDERALRIPAIIISYIPNALPLNDNSLTYPNVLTPDLCTSFLRTVDSLPDYGVIHGDINPHNALFTPSGFVIIDFGEAPLRNGEDTEETWRREVVFHGDGRRARWLLKTLKGVGEESLRFLRDPWGVEFRTTQG